MNKNMWKRVAAICLMSVILLGSVSVVQAAPKGYGFTYQRATAKFGVYTYTKGKCKLMIEMDSKNKVSRIIYLAK